MRVDGQTQAPAIVHARSFVASDDYAFSPVAEALYSLEPTPALPKGLFGGVDPNETSTIERSSGRDHPRPPLRSTGRENVMATTRRITRTAILLGTSLTISGALLAPQTVAATHAAQAQCHSLPVTDTVPAGGAPYFPANPNLVHVIKGTSGNDDIHGGNLGDTICGMDGSDRIDGGPGNDTLLGGKGTNDVLLGNSGNDIIRCGPDGADFADGGNGAEVGAGDTFLAPDGCEGPNVNMNP
jgi:hypothetical protein